MARPKGSKNKTKINTNETPQEVKRPRGRPRKTPVEAVVKEKRPRGRPRKNQIDLKVQPNTNLEEFEDAENSLTKLDLPEMMVDDVVSVVESYRSSRWTSDDWSGSGFDNFSISSDFMY